MDNTNKEFNNLLRKIEDRNKLQESIPLHVAVIMDGNGRWAVNHGEDRLYGHKRGVGSARDIIEMANDVGVKYLTLYTFSKENWNRPEIEVNALMSLLVSTLFKEINSLMDKNVRVKIIGNIEDLPDKARNSMLDAIKTTSNNTGLTLFIAVSYSGRDEIINAVKNIVNDGLAVDKIDEIIFSDYLYTKRAPDPELVIRTGGEFRVSNFLLWQIAYSEIYVTDVFWPEFDKFQFLKAIDFFQSRERRFGKTTEQIKDNE